MSFWKSVFDVLNTLKLEPYGSLNAIATHNLKGSVRIRRYGFVSMGVASWRRCVSARGGLWGFLCSGQYPINFSVNFLLPSRCWNLSPYTSIIFAFLLACSMSWWYWSKLLKLCFFIRVDVVVVFLHSIRNLTQHCLKLM